jgi:hypothetical protein
VRICLIVLMMGLAVGIGYARNVTELGNYDPPGLCHYNDVVYRGGSVAYLCGSSGFQIIDLANLSAPSRTGVLTRPNQEPLPNCAVSGNLALVCAVESGLHVVNITNPVAPTLLHSFEVGTRNFEDAQFLDNQTAVCCIGGAGIGVLSLATPANPIWVHFYTQELSYTRAAALSSDHNTVYVACDSGLVIYTRSGNALTFASSLHLTGTCVDVQASGNHAYVARGADGVSIVDVTSPTAPFVLSQFAGPGIPSKLSINDTLLAVADWDDFEIYDVSDPTTPVEIGYRYTPQRAMCVAMSHDTLVVGDWEILRIYRYGIITGPDLEVTPREIHFAVTAVGDSRSATLQLINFGLQNVIFNQIQINNPNYTLNFSNQPLPPGDTVAATLTYTPTVGQTGNGALQFGTNDPDEPVIRVNLTGNPPPGGVSVGNAAPDFTLPVYGGGEWTLSQNRGRIVVMCFFASW